MSAIFGYYMPEKTKNNILSAMKKWHVGYGSDSSAEIIMDKVGMGCVLNHIPVAVPMDNPVLTDKNITAVIDALLYNRDELAEMIPEIDIISMSDERLLLTIFMKFGEDGLRKVNGDFAGAVYDGEKLTLFRDHMGIRSLYWYQDERMVAFGTDLRGILAIEGVDSTINEEALFVHLSGYLMDESEVTDFAKINEIRPGSVVVINQDLTVEKKIFWRIGEKKIKYKTEEEYRQHLRELVEDSVRRRMEVVRGETIGTELSGGLDSTVISILLKQMGAELRCFSWSPNPEELPLQHHDEREIIEEVCRRYDMQCQYGFNDAAADDKFIVDHLKEEYRIPGLYYSYVNSSSKYFKETGARICFSGWGGDEGVSHRCNPYELWYHGEYLSYLRLQWSRCSGWKKPLRFLKKIFYNLTQDKKYFNTPWNVYAANDQTSMSYMKHEFYDYWKDKATLHPEYFPYNPIEDIEMGANRTRTETAVFSENEYGVQCVFPFLDYRVEDFAVSIPRRLYMYKNENRKIYRDTFSDLMPDSLYHYRYKDDPARCKAMSTTFLGKDYLICLRKDLLKMINRKEWEKYIDFEKLENSTEQENNFALDMLNDELIRCIQIQQLQNIT